MTCSHLMAVSRIGGGIIGHANDKCYLRWHRAVDETSLSPEHRYDIDATGALWRLMQAVING